VVSRLLYAAGYNVPENYVTHLEPANLVVDPGAVIRVQTRDRRQPLEKRPMTAADLQAVLDRANPGGRAVRVLASRFLTGIPVGPFRYTGVRSDDANDIYSHEHRREIRGLYIVASWINHADMKEENTLDMFDPQTGLVHHYLIDFGAAMGSNSVAPSNPRRGQANSFDVKDSLIRLATLGLYVHDYERAPRTVRHPSVGYLDTDLFKPDRWKPMYPCPAFENLTLRDAFWGTRIVTSFTDAQIEAAVSAGHFSDPEAAAALADFLIERRDRIGRFWFAKVNAIDAFEASGAVLRFADLAVERGYAAAAQTRYRYRLQGPDGRVLAQGDTSAPSLTLRPEWQRLEFVAASVLPQRPGSRSSPVVAFLRPADGEWQVVGLRRQD
jgi:hypothetical protein